ncbi:MAG: MBL fold metallo-hydrolase [Hydrogenovibrio sp.]|nr:MBL fold metallo-hydrolase [Hydrogenovibrio sp.]
MSKLTRRSFFKNAFAASAGMVGMSALKPLYANTSMEFKGPAVPDIDAVKVSSRCYYVPALGSSPSPENFGMFSNPGFIVTSEGVVVIDTGSSVQIGEMVLRQIKKVTDKPVVMVINTHYHGDHWLGNHAFVAANPNVKLYSHQATQTVLKNGADKFWFDFMQTNTNNKITGTVITIPDQTLKGDEVFKLGDTTLKIHHYGKMHTESDVAVEVVEDKTMYMGDMVMRRVANMEDGSYQGTINGLAEVEKLPVENFIPMHGRHEGVQLIKDGKQFMETIYHTSSKYYEEGLSDFEIKPKIMADPFMKKVASQWPGYDGALGKFVVVAIKEYEQSMF